MPGITRHSVLVIAAVGILSLVNGASRAAEPVRFNDQIRPLLSDRCFACHGPDPKRREADLRLDIREAAIGKQDGPLAITPGDPAASPLWERITSADHDSQMPPPSAKKPKFTQSELDLIKRWIDEGAEYEGHWAFLPLRVTPPPRPAASVQHPVDAFIRQQLARAKVAPSPAADRATLLRRVTLDLTGLLPSPEEIRSFVDDPDETAYERVVDRLLASPAFGERWGRHWLDQARYADSNGYAIDAPRDMWPYRDWVIDALNRDLPFDQFTIEQLAGDLLPGPSKSQLIATAFHRNTLINQEGGSDREQFRVEAVMDRVNTTGAVWLGLTVGCAQCHTHKFDPITQHEYYRLLAFFNSAQDANDRGPTVDVRRGEVFGNPEILPGDAESLSKQQLAALRNDWEQVTRKRLEMEPEATTWVSMGQMTAATASGKGGFQKQTDGSLLYDRKGTPNERFVIEGTIDLQQLAAVRLRVLTDPSLPKNGPGTAGNGNFVLSEFLLRIGDERPTLGRAFADHEQPDFPISAAVDGDKGTGWAINVGAGSTAKMNADHEAIFVLSQPATVTGRKLAIEMAHDVNQDYLIGRFSLEFSATVPAEHVAQDLPLLPALKKTVAERTKDEQAALQAAFEKSEPRARPRKKEPDPRIAQLMVMRELPAPRETYLMTRGDFTRPDKQEGRLSPGVLSAVSPPLPAASTATRMELARWLMDPANPLTARVAVNRVWMHYFGRGLVETEEDFGTQGTPPSHPDLLDWLSREFQRDWSTKRLHRLIVTSAAYRQSSRERPDLAEIDPRNLLLARQQRIRMEAELTRDAALCASGMLNGTLGGPSVHPPQPEGVYAFTQVNRSWPTETGPQRFRRTLYTFFYRSSPYPLFTTFDAPDFQATCTRRLRSNTPLQALTLANDTVFLELSQGLALRLATEISNGNPAEEETAATFARLLDDRIQRAVLLTFSRHPTRREAGALREFVLAQLADFSRDLASADKLITPELRRRLSGDQAASLVLLARVLFNADNFITRE